MFWKGEIPLAIRNDKADTVLRDSQIPFVSVALPAGMEKRFLNPIRFRVNYRIVPGFVAVCAACILLVLLLGNADADRFAPIMVGLLFLVGAASVALLLTVPKTRRQELAVEMQRYSFDTSTVAQQESYTVAFDDITVTLSGNGLTLGEKFYWYNHLAPKLVTSNRFHRIWIAVQFGAVPGKELFVPLTPTVVQAVKQFPIPLQNYEMLDFLLSHKENVFAQIYQTGTFRTFD